MTWLKEFVSLNKKFLNYLQKSIFISFPKVIFISQFDLGQVILGMGNYSAEDTSSMGNYSVGDL